MGRRKIPGKGAPFNFSTGFLGGGVFSKNTARRGSLKFFLSTGRWSMPVIYAEEKNMFFQNPAGPARSCFHENINSHQSVPVGLHLFSLRTEWISSFHSDASAQRSCGTVPRSDVRFEISPGRLRASGDFGRVASDRSLRAARTHDSGTDHREHFLVSRLDESGRYRTGGVFYDFLGGGVCL